MANRPPRQPTTQPQSGNTEEHRDLVRWTRVLSVATVFLVIASVVSDFFIYQQWRSAVDTQTDTREQLRAVVTQDSTGEIVNQDQTDKAVSYGFIITFKNVGGTRAEKFVAWASVKYFDGDVPNNIDLTKPYNRINLQYGVLGPNSSTAVTIALSGEEGQKIIDKKGVALLWGHAEYIDIYNPEKIHQINFCTLMNSAIVAGNPGQSFLTPQPYAPDCNNSS